MIEIDQYEQPYKVQVQGLEPTRKNLMTELKAQLVICQSELDQMRDDKASMVVHQNKQQAEYKSKINDERKRIAFLTKEINFIETEMVNTAGYRRIYDLEGERKNLKKAI